MRDLSRRERYPWWVRLSLWGSPNRAAVWVWFWMCLLGAAVAVGLAVALNLPVLYFGLLWVPAAGLYAAAIRWVDTNDRW